MLGGGSLKLPWLATGAKAPPGRQPGGALPGHFWAALPDVALALEHGGPGVAHAGKPDSAALPRGLPALPPAAVRWLRLAQTHRVLRNATTPRHTALVGGLLAEARLFYRPAGHCCASLAAGRAITRRPARHLGPDKRRTDCTSARQRMGQQPDHAPHQRCGCSRRLTIAYLPGFAGGWPLTSDAG